MALPIKVVDINTATWSNHKNQSHGGIQPTLLTNESEDDATFFNLGDSAEFVGNNLSLVPEYRGHKMLRVRFYFQKVGSPTGNIFVDVRPPTTPGSGAPDFTVLQSRSLVYPVSSIPTSGKNEVIFSFPIPAILPTDPAQINIFLILNISVQGDASNYVKVYRRGAGSSAACGSRAYGSSTWVADITRELSYRFEISQTGATVFGVDSTNNKIRAYKTTDNGTTWSEQAAAGAPTCLSTAGMKSINAQGSFLDDTTYVSMFTAALDTSVYKALAASWSFVAVKSFGAQGANVSGNGPIGGGRRPNGNLIAIVQGATETNMGAPWRRIKLAYWNGSTWSAEYDVVGSANTPDATLPGINIHFDLRWSAVDPNGDCHIVYSKSDTSTLQYRKFKANNTFTTINTLNGAVASATANYPVGQGTILYKSPDYYVAIPYVDNTSNTLKEARVKTTISETAANWVLTEIVAASAEVSGSNPAVLVADNSQGGKVFCWRVIPTTKGLRFTDDGGNSTWKPEIDWKGATQVVGGISGFYLEDGIALVYLEEGTTPDELRYDRL